MAFLANTTPTIPLSIEKSFEVLPRSQTILAGSILPSEPLAPSLPSLVIILPMCPNVILTASAASIIILNNPFLAFVKSISNVSFPTIIQSVSPDILILLALGYALLLRLSLIVTILAVSEL